MGTRCSRTSCGSQTSAGPEVRNRIAGLGVWNVGSTRTYCRASTRFGLRSTWLTAMLLFALGSLASLLAQDIWTLTAARALQGLGGGALEPLMVTTLAAATPPKRMGRTMSAMAVVMEIGPLLGPTLGGAAVDAAGWRSIYVGFALASATMLTAGALALRKGERHSPPRWNRSRYRFDGADCGTLGFGARGYARRVRATDTRRTHLCRRRFHSLCATRPSLWCPLNRKLLSVKNSGFRPERFEPRRLERRGFAQ